MENKFDFSNALSELQQQYARREVRWHMLWFEKDFVHEIGAMQQAMLDKARSFESRFVFRADEVSTVKNAVTACITKNESLRSFLFVNCDLEVNVYNDDLIPSGGAHVEEKFKRVHAHAFHFDAQSMFSPFVFFLILSYDAISVL